MLNSMKAVNLWKTLFCAALALTTFSACSDDDKDDDGGMPSITVNGEASTTVAVKLDGGTTDAIEVVSTGSWVLTLDDETATWCHPSKETGSKGKTTLTFTVDKWEGAASDAERSVTAKLLTNGSFEGIPIPKTATVIVKQNGDGSTEVATNVKEIRDKLTFPDKATEITESMIVTGIVVSDVAGNNINNKSFMIADNTTEPGAGLFIRLKGENTIAKMGNIIQFELKGGSQQSYFGTLQVNFTDATADPKITVLDSNNNTPEPITVEDVSKLAEYQSQYVQVYSQPAADIIGQKYYSNPASSGYANKTFVTRTGESFSLSFGSFTKDWAGAAEIPGKSGYIKGCVSINSNLGNISPRNADDLKGMTEPLFEVETTTTKISEITAEGSYTIEKATVVSISAKSFVIGDGTGYICVYKTTAQTVAVGDLVTVAGTVAPYAKGMEGKTALQFDAAAEVTKVTGTGTITVPAPQVVAGGEIDNITPLKYVTVTGKLAVSGNFYNIDFSDYTGDQTGSLLDASASLDATVYNGMDVKVTGWYVYTNTSKYFNIIADKIELVSTDPVVKFTSTPSAFAAENPVAQTVEYVAMNVTGNPTFEISEGAEYFEVGTITATTVEVKAKGNNTTNAAFNGKLVAKVGGVEKASAVLSQFSANVTNYIPLTEAPADWSGSYVVGYPNGKVCYILNEKFAADAEKTTFTYTKLEAPLFDGTNIVFNADYHKVTLAKIEGTNYYSMKYGEEYVGWVSGDKNNCHFTKTPPTVSTPNYQWTPEFTTDTDGAKWVVLTLTTKDGDKSREFMFNSNSGQERFSTYTGTQKSIMLYKLQ